MSEENIHAGHRERLKNKYLKYGLESFSDIEAIELLLFFAIPRRSTNELAHALLSRFHSFRGVLDAELSELESVPGIGTNAALLLKLVTSLNARYAIAGNGKNVRITGSTEAGTYLMPYFSYRRDEGSMLLCMDAGGSVIDCHALANGSPGMVGLAARDLVEIALRDKAARVILAHNHPSGVALPSNADIEATRQIYEVLQMIEVELMDHIIIGENDFVSMRDSGYFRQF